MGLNTFTRTKKGTVSVDVSCSAFYFLLLL